MKRQLSLVPVAVFVLLVAGCGGSGESTSTPSATAESTPSTGPITGTVSVESDFAANVMAENTNQGGTCVSPKGFDDVTTGAQVTVTDASGDVVGVGSLRSTGLQVKAGSTAMTDAFCEFAFRVPDVPLGGKFYGVEVAHRGSVQYAEDKAFIPLDLSVGDVPN